MPAEARRILCERKFTGLQLAEVGEDGTFQGYASLFGVEDLARDVVEAGAFADTIAERGAAGIRMLYQHDPNQPIGRWTDIREDRRGLHVTGRLAVGTARGREVLALMRSGALDGLSIGFKAIRARRQGGVRRILKADLWEVSVVTFPMLPGARVETVKAARRPIYRDRTFTQLAVAIRRAAATLNSTKRRP